MADKLIHIDEEKVEIKKLIKVDEKQWAPLIKKAKDDLVKNLKIDGFRKGKVPADQASKYISDAKVFESAFEAYLKESINSIYTELKEVCPRIVPTQPEIRVKKIDKDVLEFEVVYPLESDLSSLKFEKVKTKFELPKITKKDIDKYIENKLKEVAVKLPLEKGQKTQNGDTVTLDYKGFVDGVEFDGGYAKNFELKLGSKTFIDTFEDQLLDKEVGYKGEVVVTFPKEYPVDKLANKKATFQVEILKAVRPEATKLSDENLYALRAGQAKNETEARDVLKWILLNNKIEVALNTFIEKYTTETLDNNDVKINDMFVHYQVEQRKKEIVDQLKQQDIKFSEYLNILDKSEEQFKELVFKEEKKSIAFSLIAQHLLKEVSKEEDATQDEINTWANITSMSTGLPTVFLTGFFMTDENNKNQITSRIIERRNITALVQQKDPESYAKLVELESKLNTEAKRIADEWNKRAEELKAKKEAEMAEAEAKSVQK